MLKPTHAAFIDGLRLRFFQPPTEDRRPDQPWHSTDDLMVIAGLDPDERAEFRRCAAASLWGELHKTIATDGGLTVIAPHCVAQGFCDAMVSLGRAPGLRDAYDKAVVAAVRDIDLDDLLNARRRWAAYTEGDARRQT